MLIRRNNCVVSLCAAMVLCACGTDVHKVQSYPTLSKPEIMGVIKDRKVGEGVLRTSVNGINLVFKTGLEIYISEVEWDLIPISATKKSLESRNKAMTDHFMLVVGLNAQNKEEQASIRNITGMITFLDDGSALYPSKINQGKRRDCSSMPFLGKEINEPLTIEYRLDRLSVTSGDDLLADRTDLPLYTCFQFVYDHPIDPRRVFEFRLGELVHSNGQVNPVRVFFEPGNLRYGHP